jgi:hypothetical protein
MKREEVLDAFDMFMDVGKVKLGNTLPHKITLLVSHLRDAPIM